MASDFRSKISAFARKVKNAATEALFPSNLTCDFCGEDIACETRLRLCADCYERLPFVGDKFCLVCGVPVEGEGKYCDKCRDRTFKFEMARAPLVYEGYARQMILNLKLKGKKYLAYDLACMMADRYIDCEMNCDIAVFAPMTAAEEKKRGFNQAELLAQEVADRLKLPLLPALVKIKDTSMQKQLTEKQRQENLEGAFECVYNQVKNRRILLVDDVFTTGATANECASALLKAGAANVQVLTAAVTKKAIIV